MKNSPYIEVRPQFSYPAAYGDDFEHPHLKFFGLPEKYSEIDWNDPATSSRWENFYVFYAPISIAYREEKIMALGDQLVNTGDEAQWISLQSTHAGVMEKLRQDWQERRETLRTTDPDYPQYHPEERYAWPTKFEVFDELGIYCGPTMEAGMLRQDGELEWPGKEMFWPDFHHEWMVFFGLPLRFARIDWKDPRSVVKWNRFIVWFLPIFLEEGIQAARRLSISTTAINQLEVVHAQLRASMYQMGYLWEEEPPFAELKAR